jgi:hypothetical protein
MLLSDWRFLLGFIGTFVVVAIWLVVYGATLRERDDLDHNQERFLHDFALEAALLAVTRVVEGDAELKAVRMERDHFQKIAEQALLFQTPRPIVIPK